MKKIQRSGEYGSDVKHVVRRYVHGIRVGLKRLLIASIVNAERWMRRVASTADHRLIQTGKTTITSHSVQASHYDQRRTDTDSHSDVVD